MTSAADARVQKEARKIPQFLLPGLHHLISITSDCSVWSKGSAGVYSGVPQGLILGSLLINTNKNDFYLSRFIQVKYHNHYFFLHTFTTSDFQPSHLPITEKYCYNRSTIAVADEN